MKNNLLPLSLTGVFFLVTVACGVLLCYYNGSMRELQDTQARNNILNYRRTVLNSLLNETVEYSKKNPGIEPVLQPFIGAGKTTMPAGRPPGK